MKSATRKDAILDVFLVDNGLLDTHSESQIAPPIATSDHHIIPTVLEFTYDNLPPLS